MTVYTIYIEGTERYTDVSEDEFFDIMQDLAIDNYETGVPALSDISYTMKETNAKVKKSLLGTQFIEATPKKTRQGSGQHTKYAATSRNAARKRYRGQGKK